MLRHLLRIFFVDTSKRYCPNCKKKWRVKSHRLTNAGSGVLIFILLIVAALAVRTFAGGELTGGSGGRKAPKAGKGGLFSTPFSGGASNPAALEKIKQQYAQR